MTSRKKYFLRDKEDQELSRLAFQHQVWSEETAEMLRRAGFRLGHSLVDLGCGPGYLSFDLSKIVGPNGKVIAVDNSKKFIDYIDAKIAKKNPIGTNIPSSMIFNFKSYLFFNCTLMTHLFINGYNIATFYL